MLLISSVFAESIKYSVPLREFAQKVATDNKVNILIQESVDDEQVTFFIGDKDATVYLPAFKKMLYLKGLDLKKDKSDFYYIEPIPEKKEEPKKEPEPIKDVFHSVTLKNPVFVDVENLLKMHDGVKYTYISSTNSVSFFCKPEYSAELLKSIASLDVPYSQIQFKITVLETSLEDIKDRGANLSAYMQSVQKTDSDGNSVNSSYNYFLNLITMPYSATTNVLDNSKSGFYGVLKYLNQNGFTEIKNSPVVTARNQTEASFSSVINTRYSVGTSSYSNASSTSSTSYTYRDVGLKVIIKPIIIENIVHFDLTLILEDILDNDTLKTSKKELKSNYGLQRGELLVLSGINKETQLDSSYNVPVLSSIWLLGELFKYESKTKTNSIITIAIEVL
ncbi:putative secretion pathway protein D [Sulfurospirillum halorespirans DSM 13726]|uniref:Putative secretion pathway protein D n=1 Tax=Sulfurospirillum halorespirans DSM 13726 TaxID=1193502 RepID=A0A1D7THY8_9BACT|nr:putative secretion pathway protein D [Sulfurospirillum halorespirans DSM 13726]